MTNDTQNFRLYYAETLNPRKVCALARHLGSPVEFVRVDLGQGEHKGPDFTAKNPNQKVPVLDLGGRTIWESNAIMCFLARFAGSDLWPNDERQVEVVRWLHWDAQHFLPATGKLYFEYLIRPLFSLGDPDPREIEQGTAGFRRYAAVLNDHLAGRRLLVGDSLTVADFTVAAALPYAREAHMPLGEFPEVARWHDRLNELPAWREPFPAIKAAA